MTVVGPSILELRPAKRADLVMGETELVAEMIEVKDFILKTPTSKFVEIGTAFCATVAPDGLSQGPRWDRKADRVLNRNCRRSTAAKQDLISLVA